MKRKKNKLVLLFFLLLLVFLTFFIFRSNRLTEQDIVYERSNEWYINKLKNPVCISRYNDGEWFAIRKYEGENCDNHKYFPEMCYLLKKAVINGDNNRDDYIFQSSWYVDGQLDDYSNYDMKVKFLKNDHIHDISRKNPNQWIELLNILHEYPIILVGPEHLKNCKHILPIVHIIIPSSNCFLKMDKIVNHLRNELNKHERVNVILCASMTTNCIIDELYNEVSGKHSLIDFGSSLDIVCSSKNKKKDSVHYRIEESKINEILTQYETIQNVKWENTKTITI